MQREKDSIRQTLILAALLHDIGKFWQRAGQPGTHPEVGVAFINKFSQLFPFDLLDDIRDAMGNHHQPLVHKEVEKIVKVADWLSSSEREREPGLQRQEPNSTPLVPVTSEIEFVTQQPPPQFGFNLNCLALEEASIFPRKEAVVSPDGYLSLWDKFTEELTQANATNRGADFITLLFLLRKFTSFMPSATPWETDEEQRTLPDIALFDHLKVTAAIALCLYHLLPDHLEALLKHDQAIQDTPLCLIVRGDISGIQTFIYRITQPKAETKGAAKHLRGRSFYLSLLADVVADWIVRSLGLSVANILFCGGGRFDLLVPIDRPTKNKLLELEKEVQKWLLQRFYGEIGIEFASVEVAPKDFENLKQVYSELENKLAERKQQKFRDFLPENEERLHQVCNICQVTPLSEAEACNDCHKQWEIGGKLPQTDYIAYIYGNTEGLIPPQGGTCIDFTELCQTMVVLLDEREVKELLQEVEDKEVQVVLYRLNDTAFIHKDAPENVAFGFKFLGNRAPVALKYSPPLKTGLEPVRKGEVLDFAEIAGLSDGAKLLGVLKADVDYLGQIFGSGIEPATISRISTLSNAFDLFFTGWLNEICKQVSNEWRENLPQGEQSGELVEEVFYVVYSGGDDLLILGPWNQIIELAKRLSADFRKYACHNDNVTLSAGILLVKPHFPIQRFAQLVSEELERSKKDADWKRPRELKEKNRATLFGETVKWEDGAKGLGELLRFGEAMAKRVENNELPKSFVYFLKQLHDQHFQEDGACKPMWLPKFHYAVARRVKKEVMKDPDLDLLFNTLAMMEHIRIPVSYVSLKTRKEE